MVLWGGGGWIHTMKGTKGAACGSITITAAISFQMQQAAVENKKTKTYGRVFSN